MALIENKFVNPDQLNNTLANAISQILSQAIADSGSASLVVSGGRTPLPLFKLLSQQKLEWSKVTVGLADERWVDNTHSDSNERLVRDNLLVAEASAAKFFAMKTKHADASDAVTSLTESAQQPAVPFDVLILGMGEDAHTASLFPCCEQITQGLDICSDQSFIATIPKTAPHQRMSYTLPVLVKAKNIFLHLTGEKKLEVLLAALASDDELEKPIKAVVDRSSVNLMWAP